MIGDAIKELRRLKKIKQKELAEGIGVSVSAIGMYEQNRRIPDIDTMVKIASFFGVTLDAIVNYDPDNPERCKLIALLDTLTPEELNEMEFYINFITERRIREQKKTEKEGGDENT